MIIRNKQILFKDGEINQKALLSCIKAHEEEQTRYKKLQDYYDGEHAILNRSRKLGDVNNKIVANHAEYITDFATAYFGGNPIKYVFPEAEKRNDDDILEKAFKKANIDHIDTALIREASIFGKAFELIYQDEEGATKSININPSNCFVIYDDTVEHRPLLGAHINARYDEEGKEVSKVITVYTKASRLKFEYKSSKLSPVEMDNGDRINVFGDVPIIEYSNKVNQKGDFESVIPLIDAYNKLQSDRINDKEQFVDALLVIYGMLAGDTSDEKVETAKELKRLGMLEMDNASRAEFITKTFQEGDIELLKKSIAEDIHKISKVPNLTDENFAGNSSGVAMAYKLLGLEQLAQTKESYYRIGLKKRLKLYASILKIKSIEVDVDEIEISFTRSLPVNLLELSQLIANLKDTVSRRTLLNQLPFIEDAAKEEERLEEEKKSSLSSMQKIFGGYDIEREEDENI